MRILLTGDTVGGVWTQCLELARALGEHGAEVHLATMGRWPTAAQRRQAAEIECLTFHPSAWRLEWMPDPWDDLARAGAWLLELEAALRPDVVHLAQMGFGALAWRAPHMVTVHSCVLSWWEAVHGVPAPPEWDRYRDVVGAGLAATPVLAAPSAHLADRVRALYGTGPVHAVHNGRDAEPFVTASIEGKAPLVLSVGRLWDEAKNAAAVSRAAAGLPWPVVLAGEGGARAPAGSAARFLGALDDGTIATWMRRAAIYALPARYEPFGLSILEAAHAGCALVLGDVPSLRELWHGAAVFVEPGDDAALGDALRRLIADPAHRRSLARRARARARRFTPARMAAEYLALYAAAGAPTEALACAS